MIKKLEFVCFLETMIPYNFGACPEISFCRPGWP